MTEEQIINIILFTIGFLLGIGFIKIIEMIKIEAKIEKEYKEKIENFMHATKINDRNTYKRINNIEERLIEIEYKKEGENKNNDYKKEEI